MQQVPDEVVLDDEVALVDVGDERQAVHVLEDGPLRVVDDPAVADEADAGDRRRRACLRRSPGS